VTTRPPVCPDLDFDENRHVYTLHGRVLPSVTTILAAEGLAGDVSHFTDEHRTMGTMRHLVTELHDQGDLDEDSLDPALVPALDAWRRFVADTGFEPHYIEEKVYSDLGYAGRIDRVGTIGRDLTIIDVKGASDVPSYGPQVHLYAHAWRERTGEQPTKLLCVHLQKDGTYRVKTHNDRTALSVGLSAVTLHAWKRANVRARRG